MRSNPFKNRSNLIKEQFQLRERLMAPFIKSYGNPIIVHAVHDIRVFKKILTEGKLKLPSTHDSPQKSPYMERFLGIDNCVYYSLGFEYFTSYQWRYNIVFDVKQLKKLVYYKHSVNYQAARAVVDYWYENDREYLEKLANSNPITRKVIDRYYYEPYNGKTRKILEFWKIENELFEYISQYPQKNILIKLIRKKGEELLLKYPDSKEDALSCYVGEKATEIVGKSENNLLKNIYFLGFFIDGHVDKEILRILKQMYPEKILFDGKKIKKVKEF